MRAKVISTKLEAGLIAQLTRFSVQRGWTVSQAVRHIITLAIKHPEKFNQFFKENNDGHGSSGTKDDDSTEW